MKKYMLKILALGIAAGLVFGFAACGSGPEVDPESTTDQAVTLDTAFGETEIVATEAMTETETQTEAPVSSDDQQSGGSSSGKGSGRSGGQQSGSGGSGNAGNAENVGNAGNTGGNQTPDPEPAPEPLPDFDPDTVIEMVHQKVKANPDIQWIYDIPGIPENEHTYLGWFEVPGNFYPTMTMQEIAQDLYEACLSEYKWGGCDIFYVEYWGTRDDGCYRWKIYR